MGALAGVNGDVWLSTSPPTALGSPESCTDTGDHQHYFASSHRAWDSTQTFTIENSPDGSTWTAVSASDYEVYWPVGEIVFTAVQTDTHVRISAGSYFTLTTLDGAHKWSAQYKGTVKDVTPFQASGGWAVYASTLKSLTFSVDCYRYDARVLNEMISSGVDQINISGGIIACYLYFDKSNSKYWAFYALPTGIDETVVANAIDTQTVKMSASGPLYLITSSTLSTTTVTRM